jgi:hypothetical protein
MTIGSKSSEIDLEIVHVGVTKPNIKIQDMLCSGQLACRGLGEFQLLLGSDSWKTGNKDSPSPPKAYQMLKIFDSPKLSNLVLLRERAISRRFLISLWYCVCESRAPRRSSTNLSGVKATK